MPHTHFQAGLLSLLRPAVVVVSSTLVSTMALAQTESIVYSFNGVSGGANPTSQLIADKAGNLYGTTLGPSDGTVFELIRLTGGQVEEVTLHSFSGSDGSGPLGGLVMDSKGNLYGTTYEGGNYGSGVVYELQPTATGSWDFTVIHNFHYDGVSNFDGLHPAATLVLDGKGNLYGTTEIGGTGLCNEATDTINRTVSPPKGGSSYSCGTVFEVSPQKGGNWSEQVIHNFQGTDGGLPLASMIFDRGGNLFGTTASGGFDGNLCVGVWVSGCGTVFELARNSNGSWTESVLYYFQENQTGVSDSSVPASGLRFDAAGNLFGANGGVFQEGGALFELSPGSGGSWTETTLINLDNEAAGFGAVGNPLQDSVGNLYGTTQYGSAPGASDSRSRGNDSARPPKPFGPGTVYKLSPTESGSWTATWLHTFGTGTDGIAPAAGLLRMGNALYGTTLDGGANGYGTVFRLVP